MSIDRSAGGTAAPAEWKVCVSVSVLAIVPPSILTGWLAVESFARDKPACWPSNAALAKLMHVGSATVVKAILLRLEEHGVIGRHDLGGNRRSIVLRRRVSDPITVAEWSALVAAADQRRAERGDDDAPIKNLDRGASKDYHQGASHDAPMGRSSSREKKTTTQSR